jgi:cytochrome c biogenesis protein CcmG, thiol:disulfide interchange protein DsbE
VPRRPILLALAIAVLATLTFVVVTRVDLGPSPGRAAVGAQAPDVIGITLDGHPFDLTDARGRPVVVNFWGPSCVPCRDEFPLLESKSSAHAADGLTVVGVLTDDPPEPARDFVARYGADWPTVVDPDGSIKTAYRVAARPQSYFIDGDGVIRSIQIGEVTDVDFERQYQRIAP